MYCVTNRRVSRQFSLAVSNPNTINSSWVTTTNCRLYCNFAQLLLLCQTWGYYNKLDSTKSLGGGGGILLMCHNSTMRVYEARFKTYDVLCRKTYSSFDNVSELIANSRPAARSVRIYETDLFVTRMSAFITHISRMRLSSGLLWENRNALVAVELTCITLIFTTRIFCREVSGLVTDCFCGVWSRGLTTCPCISAQLLAYLL